MRGIVGISWIEAWKMSQRLNSGSFDNQDESLVITLEEIKYLTKKVAEIESKPPSPITVYSSADLSQDELKKLIPSVNGNGGAHE